MSTKKIMKRLSNPGTLIGIVGLLTSIVLELGFNIDKNQILTITKQICQILILIGVMNNPDEPGML